MNTLTTIFTICSGLWYIVLIRFLFKSPQRVFPTMMLELLENLNQKNPENWKETKDNYLWAYFQDYSIRVFENRKIYLFKIIFLEGGFLLLVWVLITALLVFAKDWGLENYIPAKLFFNFLIGQIFIFGCFYFFHLKRFKDYLFMGEKHKFLEEIKKIKEENI